MATATTKAMSPPSPQLQTQATTRKRRRRAPTTGASEDCHTCRKRGTSCDRRRPYCSQCLDIGKECSGYRTTLTWGVGVASRGKLRGQSLPVVNMVTPAMIKTAQNASISPTVKSPPSTSPTQTSNRGESSTESPRKRARVGSSTVINDNQHGQPLTPSLPSPPYTIPDQDPRLEDRHWYHVPINPDRRRTFDAPHHFSDRHQDSTQLPPYSGLANSSTLQPFADNRLSPILESQHRQSYPPHLSSPRPYAHQYLHQAQTQNATPHFIDPFLAQSDFPQHQEKSAQHQQDDVPIVDPQQSSYPQWRITHQEPPHHMWLGAGSAVHDQDGKELDPSIGIDTEDVQTSYHDQGLDTFKIEELDEGDDTLADVVGIDYTDAELAIGRHHPDTMFSPQNFYSISPRMQYLLDYYAQNICSVLVAVDGPTNPYRAHILPLAYQNAGLQSALAALATNNMRMRQVKNIPRLKDESEHGFDSLALDIGRPSAEEQHYKGMSIESLNSQLTDSVKARDDSVLATLLILCLFHVCDSGFSKFKTQLAGVQKLLKLRGGSGSQSNFIGWIEMFFAWFDVMTSAVNDRELQIQGESIDLMNLSNNLGALEQFSGCDGRLFKLIARLGRLNLLSQGRPVNGLGLRPSYVRQSSVDSRTSFKNKDFYSMDFDEESEDAQPSLTAEPQDTRDTFWTEWRDVRERLESLDLSVDTTTVGSSPASNRDMALISESFRYSALLYTERLAHPNTPSSSSNIQNYVNRSLHHIKEIGENSCVLKFMLWPLFITGTECVKTEHRELIRNMCIYIQQESGFYNNVSGLEVLERVWKGADDGGSSQFAGCGSQAFAWRRAMDRVDGEYIVI